MENADIKQVQNYRKNDCSELDVCRACFGNLLNKETMILALID